MDVKFEYMSITLESKVQCEDESKELNKYGSEGWELVSVVKFETGILLYYFKRCSIVLVSNVGKCTHCGTLTTNRSVECPGRLDHDFRYEK